MKSDPLVSLCSACKAGKEKDTDNPLWKVVQKYSCFFKLLFWHQKNVEFQLSGKAAWV